MVILQYYQWTNEGKGLRTMQWHCKEMYRFVETPRPSVTSFPQTYKKCKNSEGSSKNTYQQMTTKMFLTGSTFIWSIDNDFTSVQFFIVRFLLRCLCVFLIYVFLAITGYDRTSARALNFRVLCYRDHRPIQSVCFIIKSNCLFYCIVCQIK